MQGRRVQRYLALDEMVAWVNRCDPGAIDPSVFERGSWELENGLDTPVSRFAANVEISSQAAESKAFATYGVGPMYERWVGERSFRDWVKRKGLTPILPLAGWKTG